jgi:dihydroflavonol-4-reductase
MASTVLVTGGNGFVAGWCIVQLLEQGYAARTTVRSLERESMLRASVSRARHGDRLAVFAADLLDDAGWDEAVGGVDYVLHVASPVVAVTSGDRHELVKPARDGTLRVLKAAVKAGVKRVVMTSAAATTRQPLDKPIVSDETMWADAEDPQFDAYRVSKILAEKAAWDFMNRNGGKTEFATVLPGAVFGPVLTRENLSSVSIIDGLLGGRPPLLPKLGFWIVDVRDLADLHIKVMLDPAANGQRFIGAGDFLWMRDIARILRAGLGAAGARVPTRQLPSFLVPLLLPFQPLLKTIAPLIGKRIGMSTAKARKVLGFAPRPAEKTLLDCAKSLPSS